MPRAARAGSGERALKRLERLQARVPEELRDEFGKAIAQLRTVIEATHGEQQAMADQVTAHEAAIGELQQRADELGQANANQARLLSALTQADVGAPGPDAPIIRPLPTIEPLPRPSPLPPTGVPSPAPDPSPAPSQAPPAATPVAIAAAFQQAFVALQATPGAGGSTIRSMDVQVKGLVQVADDGSTTTLTFPTPEQPLTGDVLSTVSMSLGAVPELAPSKPPG